MRKTLLLACLLALVPAFVLGNTVSSSTIQFQGDLTDNGDGTYTGVVAAIVGGSFDIFGEEGEDAWFGDDPGTGAVWTTETIASNDAWPSWDPDTPDWWAYSLSFYEDGGLQRWALRNHPAATETNPWYDEAHWGVGGTPPAGVPMSGVVNWGSSYAAETEVGAYLPTTGVGEIPGGAATQGGGRAAWDMDWSWGSEVVPLAMAGFSVGVVFNGTDYDVTLTPADAPLVVDGGWNAFIIRENATEGAPLIYGNSSYGIDAVEFAIFAASQKAGLGTDKVNGVPVSNITGLHVDRLDDIAASGSLYGPYFNIWITDGLGNYAVISNEPSNSAWVADRWDVPDWDFLRTKVCKVFETEGAAAYTSWVHVHAGSVGSPLTFEDVADLMIEPPTPAYIAASAFIGTGAPDELGTDIARGFTWMFGDTADNYVSGDGEGFVVANYTADATFPVNNTTQTIGYATISAAVADANPDDTIVVDPGIYVESFNIDKSLSIYGATAGVNKNGYTVPADYAWDPAVESIIVHPDPASGYVSIVNIEDVDDVIFDGFVIGELNAVANANTSLVRIYAHTREITNINLVNCVIGPNTNFAAQDGAQGRMGLYLVNHPYGDDGIVNSTIAGNKIFDCKGNGDNIFLWTSYYAYGAPGPADMTGTVIEDNEIYGSHRSGIETAGGFANLTIRNNTIYGQTGLPGDDPDFLKYGHGIQLIRGSSDKVSDPLTAYGPVNLTIEGNEIYGNEKCGIYMGPKNTNIDIVDNVIHDNGWNGVMLDLEGNYWNPQFESPPTSGLYACFDCAVDITAVENEFYGNGNGGNLLAHYAVQMVGTPTNGLEIDAEGNWWGDASGPLDSSDDTGTGGLYNPAGLGDEVTDLVLYEPWLGTADGTIVPETTGPLNCSQTIMLTFSFTADEYTPDVFLYNAVVSATAGLDFGAVEDLLPFGTVNNNFFVTVTGANERTITGSTVGNPTYPVSGVGTTGLFTIVFSATGSVVGDVVFESLTLRDPYNHTIPVELTGAAITYDCTAPAAVTGITAAPAHNKVVVGWTHDGSDVTDYEVYRGLWYDTIADVSAYPEYDDLADDAIPARPATRQEAWDSDFWDLAGTVSVGTNTLDDTWGDGNSRGVYYYEVFPVDAAVNYGAPAAANDRATNYWLGDVSGDGLVTPVGDMNTLGTAYGTSEAGGGNYDEYCDVGPTDDWSRVGVPTTDNMINFEDLMVFAMNFGVVSSAKTADPISRVVELAWVRYDGGRLALRLVNGSGVKGLHVRADASVGAVTAGQLLDEQSEMTFLRNIGSRLDVGVAVMGVGNGFDGSGDLFVVECANGIDPADLHIDVRGVDNTQLEFELGQASGILAPRVFELKANYPNPFNPMTKISFSLPETQAVRLAVYGIDGRLVATLVNETRDAGLHEVIWTGLNDRQQPVASGVYFYRIDAGPYSQVHKMTLMK